MDTPNKKLLTKLLRRAYPNPASELNFTNEYQLIVAVILSAQCTDKKVNQVTPTLFASYPSFQQLSNAELEQLESIIRPINYYKTKARNLIGMASLIASKHNSKLPHSRDQLIELPGVGRKTANVVAGELGFEHTIPVDTHVFRVSRRLGLATGKNPVEVEQELMAQFSSDLWRPLHHWLILHGRKVCKAQSPNCSDCPISQLCPSSNFEDLMGST